MINTTSQTLYRLDNLNKEHERISYQMSTGKEIDNGSDDSKVFAREIYIKDKINVYEGIKVQIERTTAQNTASDSALTEMKTLLEYVKSEAIKAATDTTSEEGRSSIAVNFEGIKANIIMLGNEKIEGEYLFTGSNSMIKPFEEASNGEVTYEGNGYLREIAVEFGSYRDKGTTGLDAFYYANTEALSGEKLTFTDGIDRIVDEEGNEWLLDTSNPLDIRLNKSDFNGLTGDYMQVVSTANPDNPNEYITTSNVDNYLDSSGTTQTTINPKFEAKRSTFDMLDRVITALETNDVDALREEFDDIDGAHSAVNNAQADLGARNKVFELSYSRVNSKLTQFEIFYTQVASADIEKVAVEAKALEITFTSLYASIQRMNELSLVNFIR